MKPAVINFNTFSNSGFKIILSNIFLELGMIHLSDRREVSRTREGLASIASILLKASARLYLLKK